MSEDPRTRHAHTHHIVMVSWKDAAHPKRGGAETYTLTVLHGLQRQGYEVTWFVPTVQGLPTEEVTSGGVQVLRRGSTLTHFLHIWRYLLNHRHTVDLVIDQINAYPMLTCLVVPSRKGLTLVHQLSREVWFYELPRPLAYIGYRLEPLLLRLYRQRPTVTVSQSSAADLRDLGFENVAVVENALPFPLPPPRKRARPETPHFVGLGRLVRMKRFEHLLTAFAEVRRTLPDAQLTIIGRGSNVYAAELVQKVKATDGATLLENASENLKHETLAAATAVVATSVREGWGLMVSEGHAHGTPSVAYRVPGLQDSTQDGVNGLLCPPDPQALARTMLALHQDSARWATFSRAAYRGAAELTATRQTRKFGELVTALL